MSKSFSRVVPLLFALVVALVASACTTVNPDSAYESSSPMTDYPSLDPRIPERSTNGEVEAP